MTMSTTPNIIALAVRAAGGRHAVAQAFGDVTAYAITGWARTKRMPAAKVRRLCELGGNAITTEQVLQFIEDSEAEAKAHA